MILSAEYTSIQNGIESLAGVQKRCHSESNIAEFIVGRTLKLFVVYGFHDSLSTPQVNEISGATLVLEQSLM